MITQQDVDNFRKWADKHWSLQTGADECYRDPRTCAAWSGYVEALMQERAGKNHESKLLEYHNL